MNAISPPAVRNTSFAEQYRELVVPRVEAQTRVHAIYVRHDLESYSDAFSQIWWFAWRLGASHLSTALQHDLGDYIQDHLLAEIDSHAEQTERIELIRRVGREIEQHDRMIREALGA